MRHILIIAQREFLHIARTKSFWLTLIILPLTFMVMPLFSRFMAPQPTSYIMADASGRYGAVIERRVEFNHQRGMLFEFAGYARRWGLKSATPGAVWDKGERPFGDEEVAAFIAAGGLKGALAQAGPLPADTPVFKEPERDPAPAAVPADVPTTQGPEAFGKAASRYLTGGAKRPKGVRAITTAVYIPADFGAPGVAVRVWTSRSGSSTLIDVVRRETTAMARLDAAKAAGLDSDSATTVLTKTAPVVVSAPPRGQGRERVMLQSALPLGIAYFLLVSVFTSGAWLLQGVIEERSNKLLEAVLACVSPSQLMYGKLLGIVGIGFTVITVWGSCMVGAAFSLPSDMAEVIRPAMTSLSSPWLAVALIFYFITGYLICAMLFLAVGAVSESMTDAQAYLMPISLMLFLPFVVLSQLIGNPDAVGAKVLSWIPVYTPFAMMARMGGGVEPYEIIGTSILLVCFIAAEVYLLGRVFQSSLLRAGQPPRLLELTKLMFAKAGK